MFLLMGVSTLALLCAMLFRLNPKCLKHVRVFQVLRAQTHLPYTTITRITCPPADLDTQSDVVEEVISPLFTNQLGNNLFQYCYARMHALCKGARFENTDPFFSGTMDTAPFDRIAHSVHHIAFYSRTTRRVLTQRPNAFAQDISLFSGFYEEMRAWLEPSVESHTRHVEQALATGVQREDTVVLHLRFAATHEGFLYADPTYHALELDFDCDALALHQQRTGKEVATVVVVHGPGCQAEVSAFVAGLQKPFPRVVVRLQSQGRIEDFLVMYCARNLVLSISTFAWWAAFLGHSHRPKVVYYPYHTTPRPLSTSRLLTWFNKLKPEGEDERFIVVPYST